jgi:hypothetical protein
METRAAILDHLRIFNGIVDTMIGLQIDCRTGFKHNKSRIEESQVASQKYNPSVSMEEDDRQLIYFGRTDPDAPDARFRHVTTIGQYKSRNSEEGTNALLMERSIIVTMYSFWDEHFRPAIAAAAGIRKNAIQSDIFGDLRILRHCIIHQVGICDASIRKTKILKWFSEGEEIILAEHMMDTIFTEVKNAITSLAKSLTGEDVVYVYERSLQPGSSR